MNNRPRESLLTLFDPLFSSAADPATPPAPARDVPSPDPGSDKENAAPSATSSNVNDNDDSITLTKFFNRVYTRPKALPESQSPRSLPRCRGRLIDVSDAYDASDDEDDENENDENDGAGRPRLGLFVVTDENAGREGEARDSPPRRPLADIALGDGGSASSPLAMKKKCPSPSPLTRKATPSSSLFGSPSPFKLARPTPAPSSSPLASVINAINGTTSRSRSPSLTPPSTPSAPRIAVTPAEPSSPSPKGRQLRPDAMLRASASPDGDDVDFQERRISVDLQEAMSVHFEAASFDLLKDKIMFPENDSLDADLDMDMASAPAIKVPEENNMLIPIAEAGAESENELDCLDILGEQLRDMNIVEVENDLLPNKDRDNIISTPSEKFSKSNATTPQAPVRQGIRPKNNNAQVPPAAPAARNNKAPRASLLARRNSTRPSISSALPTPASACTTAPQATKKTTVARERGIPARKAIGNTAQPQPQAPRPRASVSTMTLSGVQRPPAPALASKIAHSRAMSVPSSTATSTRTTQSQTLTERNKQAVPSSSKVAVTGAGASTSTSGLRRPSSLRAPVSRVGASGIAVPRARASFAASAGVCAGGARRASLSTSMTVDGGGSGGGRLGLTGVNKVGPGPVTVKVKAMAGQPVVRV